MIMYCWLLNYWCLIKDYWWMGDESMYCPYAPSPSDPWQIGGIFCVITHFGGIRIIKSTKIWLWLIANYWLSIILSSFNRCFNFLDFASAFLHFKESTIDICFYYAHINYIWFKLYSTYAIFNYLPNFIRSFHVFWNFVHQISLNLIVIIDKIIETINKASRSYVFGAINNQPFR